MKTLWQTGGEKWIQSSSRHQIGGLYSLDPLTFPLPHLLCVLVLLSKIEAEKPSLIPRDFWPEPWHHLLQILERKAAWILRTKLKTHVQYRAKTPLKKRFNCCVYMALQGGFVTHVKVSPINIYYGDHINTGLQSTIKLINPLWLFSTNKSLIVCKHEIVWIYNYTTFYSTVNVLKVNIRAGRACLR